MASSSGNLTNEGISVKNVPDDPEINAMALKIKENYKKNTAGVPKKQAFSPANFYINRAGRTVPMINAPIKTNNTQNNNQETLPIDCESIKGKFSWILIAGYHVPYIIRVIKGEHLKFVSVRMAETQLLSSYLPYLNADLYTCTSVRSYFITDSEAKLLNDINQNHVDCLYGNKMFFAGKDYIVRLEDLHEFRTFIEVCYTNLQRDNTASCIEKCGFILINSDYTIPSIPYCIKDSQKYVPLFFLEGDTEYLEHQTIKLENWDLAYLKFCFMVQGIKNELFASNSCTVISFDKIKNYFPPETNFEVFWPKKLVDSQLLTNQSTHVNPSGVWIIAPPEEVVPTKNNIPRISTAPSPAVKPLVNSFSAKAWPLSTTDAYSIAARNKSMTTQLQCYNSLPTMSQGSSLINSQGYVVPPGNPAPIMYCTALYSNVVPISQCMISMCNQTTNNYSMSHSSQMPQFYAQHPSMISQTYQQQLQEQQIQQIQQQQQIISTLQTQQSYYRQPVHGCLTNTQQHNTLRNVRSISIAPVTETIDLTSPLSSPVPPTEQGSSISSNSGWELSRILEQPRGFDTSNNAAYKIQKAMVHGKTIHCINAKPYIHSDFMVILDDLVQTMLPFSTVASCAYVLNNYLSTMLFNVNSEQLAVLRENGCLRSYPDEASMVLLRDITRVFPQLRTMLYTPYGNIQQCRSLAGPSKRRRNS